MINELLEYRRLLGSLPQKVEKSPFKTIHMIKKMGMSAPTFYRKLKMKSFNFDELLSLAEFIVPKEYYKWEFEQSLKESLKDLKEGRVRDHETVMRETRERLTK